MCVPRPFYFLHAIASGRQGPRAVSRPADDTEPAWIAELSATLRDLHAARRPMLGICFGHQLLSHALGGAVEANKLKTPDSLSAGSNEFRLTPLGGALLGGADAHNDQVRMQYHHNDIVTRLPTCSANLGCSATNPAHAAAYFGSAATARVAVTRGRPPAAERPHAITMQAHPEFSTPSGRVCLKKLLEVDAAARDAQWAADRHASVDEPRTNGDALRLAAAAVRLLWPESFER